LINSTASDTLIFNSMDVPPSFNFCH